MSNFTNLFFTVYGIVILSLITGCSSQSGIHSLKTSINLTKPPSSKNYKKEILILCPELEKELDYAYEVTCNTMRKAADISSKNPIGVDANYKRMNIIISKKKPLGIYNKLTMPKFTFLDEFISEKSADIIIYTHITQAEMDLGGFNYNIYALLLEENTTTSLSFENDVYDSSLLSEPIFWVSNIEKILSEIQQTFH